MDETPIQWTRLKPIGDAQPSKRSGHSLTLMSGSNGLLFGGIDLRSPPGPNSDLYAFEISATGASLNLFIPCCGGLAGGEGCPGEMCSTHAHTLEGCPGAGEPWKGWRVDLPSLLLVD